jgi:hypothetical protein
MPQAYDIGAVADLLAGLGRKQKGGSGASSAQKPTFLFANINILTSSDPSKRGIRCEWTDPF